MFSLKLAESFADFLQKKSEIQFFNRENVLAIFDEKIEIRDRALLV